MGGVRRAEVLGRRLLTDPSNGAEIETPGVARAGSNFKPGLRPILPSPSDVSNDRFADTVEAATACPTQDVARSRGLERADCSRTQSQQGLRDPVSNGTGRPPGVAYRGTCMPLPESQRLAARLA
jgi:hypothetical protein